jgi:signal transduction histidine kinase
VRRRLRHSLSGRLLGLFLLTGLLLALVVKMGFQLALSGNLRDLAQPHVAEYVQHLLDQIGDPPDPAQAKALAERLALAIHILGPGQTWSSAGSAPAVDEARLHRHRLPSGASVWVGHAEGEPVLVAHRGQARVLLVPRGMERSQWAPLALLATLLGVLAVLALAYHAIRRLFRPVETLRHGLARIGSGDLDHRIQVRRRDELGELAASVNAMADDIRRMLEAKRQLLLAISHELRSPLTRARVNLALLPESPTRQALDAAHREMEGLIEELLESERLNSRHAPLNRTAADPAQVAREVLAEHFPDAAVAADLQDAGGGLAALDAPRIKLLMRNLLDNALRHTPDHAPPPRIRVRSGADGWELAVEDSGPGIAPQHLAQLTEPFYRADPARRRQTGGYGLGLYLCRMIAEAHGGRLEIASERGKGTRVVARFLAEHVVASVRGAASPRYAQVPAGGTTPPPFKRPRSSGSGVCRRG